MGRMKLWALRGGGSPVQVDMPGGGAHLSIWTAWRGELAYPSGDAWQGELTYPSGDAGVGESSPIHLAMPEWGLTYPAGDAYWRVGSSLVQLEMLEGGTHQYSWRSLGVGDHLTCPNGDTWGRGSPI